MKRTIRMNDIFVGSVARRPPGYRICQNHHGWYVRLGEQRIDQRHFHYRDAILHAWHHAGYKVTQ